VNCKEKVFHRIDENDFVLENIPSHRPFALKAKGIKLKLLIACRESNCLKNTKRMV
jgi:hypothetical protein